MDKRALSMVSAALLLGVSVSFLENRRLAATGNGATAGLEAQLRAEAQAALSVTHGTTKLAGLERRVTVLRDPWGVAHIYAENQHDLFFAQGFVTAQDRLFQMELWKRVGQGRLAEILGPTYLARDINARLLAYRGSMEEEYASYAPDAKQILQAFTEGINAYITQRRAPGGQGLPLEFRLAGFAPETWKPEDCLTRMAGFPMTRNAVTELNHAQLVALVGAAKASTLLDLDPPVTLDPAPGVDFSGLSAQLLRNLQGSDSALAFPSSEAAASALDLPNEPGSSKWASNNWVVSGKLTKTGRPLLSNDPHRTVDKVPSIRYVVHLVAPGWDVIGPTEPGSPGVEAGHNQRVAWGWTIFGLDQQDLYLEQLNPEDPLRYKTETGWERMRVEKATFRVKGQSDTIVDLKFTRHGPVLWEDPATRRALALRWIGAEPGTAGYLACLTMDRVQNWQEFEEAVKRWKVPSHNIVYADIDGNIGEHSVGKVPLRGNWTGTLPEPGDGGYEWSGYVPVSELPHQFNPPSGFIVTANQKMTPDNYPYKVGFEWGEPYRANRIREILSEAATSGRKLTSEDMERLQGDVTPLPAREFVRLLRSAAGQSDDPSVRLLLDWNGSLDRDSAAAVVYELWQIEVERQVAQRLAPKSVWNVVVGHLPLTVVLRHLELPDTETFGPDPAAARNQLLLDGLRVAVEKLKTMQGRDPARWSWGGLHTITFHHALELLPGAKALVSLGPVSRPGDGFTVNNTGGRNFEQTGGPSYRAIMDVGAWDNSLTVNVPGQSGQPGSPHYGDLIPYWDQARYFPMLYSRAAVEKQATERMTLEPAR